MSGPLQFSPTKGWFRPNNDNTPLPEEFVEPEPAVIAATPPQPLAPAPAPLPKLTKTQPLSTPNVLKLAKARLKEVNAELKRHKALEQEKAELERLIAAAQNKAPRVAQVRAIKTPA